MDAQNNLLIISSKYFCFNLDIYNFVIYSKIHITHLYLNLNQ